MTQSTSRHGPYILIHRTRPDLKLLRLLASYLWLIPALWSAHMHPFIPGSWRLVRQRNLPSTRPDLGPASLRRDALRCTSRWRSKPFS
ncbi:hypothetical protein C8R45DRAFT_973039 [Mycena sanguinolenta]|nr:hypothetical protein C8R45DRAFT_973039 [Mycena sanguinolenta]